MEKRALIAVALAFAVLLIYQFIFIKPEPQKIPKEVAEEKQLPEETEVLPPPLVVEIKPVPSTDKEIRVETDLYSAVISSRGASITHFELKGYKDKSGRNVVLLKEPGLKPALGIGASDDFELADISFTVSAKEIVLDNQISSGSLVFEHAGTDFSVRRSYVFYNDSYKIDIKDEVSGLDDYWITIGADFGIHDTSDSWVHSGPVLLQETSRLEFNPKKLSESKVFTGGLKWIAQEDKYFFASLVPVTPVEEARVWKIKDSALIAFRGEPGVKSFILYAGPKEYDTLKALNVGLEHIVDFGFFSIIALPLFWILKMFYNFSGNYGWAIVLLTTLVRIPFIPLVNKSQKSMKKMQDIQPKMAEVKEKYKKDPQRMQKEMMQLYKTHKVNPLGGCLPILLQIPVFFALYKILMISIELRGAPFMLWIKDLSAPDSLFGHIPAMFPLIGGFAVGPLPILMGATMVIQQKMTPTSLDPTQNKIMMLMPVIFTFMFLNFASGLVLYWLMNNVLSIVQQFYVNQKLAKEKAKE
jgi:YidC/Oxa1 family membrane protein insertase